MGRLKVSGGLQILRLLECCEPPFRVLQALNPTCRHPEIASWDTYPSTQPGNASLSIEDSIQPLIFSTGRRVSFSRWSSPTPLLKAINESGVSIDTILCCWSALAELAAANAKFSTDTLASMLKTARNLLRAIQCW
ncbi:hypothetical protein KSP40_PGU001141 [Platanthera guangdongensis]|uniref:Uncharacterized protein n=1 Tax=Platanthera guangdongensis TaxID=2320717 RepID=A0ABR2LNW4_9ASPA